MLPAQIFNQESFFSANNIAQNIAICLYHLGFNIFPQPFAQKAGIPWKQLQYTRLHADHPAVSIAALTAGQCNLAVMCGSISQESLVIDRKNMFVFIKSVICGWLIRGYSYGVVLKRDSTHQDLAGAQSNTLAKEPTTVSAVGKISSDF